ncbi:MAG: DUF3990 domain-containing protein, partial [Clostridiales bacterium]|nr:DUF3990 domain-containing protein [Clostridiales bacterium]
MHNEIDLASKSNNVITLYHGSEVTITKPLYCKGRVNTDYGPGFYAAESYDLAGEWAVLFANRDGFINEYKLDATSLNVLDIC